jgi:hypothetical protein
MAQQDEYNETMIAALDLIWGEGFMTPGGEGNIDNLVSGLDLKGKQVLDIGYGQGRPVSSQENMGPMSLEPTWKNTWSNAQNKERKNRD